MTPYRIMRGIVLRVYYPFLMFLSAFLKNKKEGFQRSVIHLNNRLVMAERTKTKKYSCFCRIASR